MKKRVILIAVTLCLSFFYLTLNARTAQRLMSQLNPAASRSATFFVEPESVNRLSEVKSSRVNTKDEITFIKISMHTTSSN